MQIHSKEQAEYQYSPELSLHIAFFNRLRQMVWKIIWRAFRTFFLNGANTRRSREYRQVQRSSMNALNRRVKLGKASNLQMNVFKGLWKQFEFSPDNPRRESKFYVDVHFSYICVLLQKINSRDWN